MPANIPPVTTLGLHPGVAGIVNVALCVLAVLVARRHPPRRVLSFAARVRTWPWSHWRPWLPAAVAVTVLALRLLLLPLVPPPVATVPDEFSYLLMGDTFAAGRMTNEPHRLWPHFETLFVLQQPTYASVYPVAQGLFLAIGQALFGEPWAGVCISVALMAAGLCWMLLGWLPLPWALFGVYLAVLQVGVNSYWINSYWGGAHGALGGALVLGALPRIVRRGHWGYGLAFGGGMVLLANSRPYEGLVLVAAAGAYLLWRVRGGAGAPAHLSWRSFWLPAAVPVALAAACMMAYFTRVTGSPFLLPQQCYMNQYAASSAFVWQADPPTPTYRNPELKLAHEGLRVDKATFSTPQGALRAVAGRMTAVGSFFLGPLMVLPVLVLPGLWRSPRMRVLLAATVALLVALCLAAPFQPHYAGPLAGVLYLLAAQSVRLLWVLGRNGDALSGLLAQAAPLVVAGQLALSALAPSPAPLVRGRAEAERQLVLTGGRYLVLVRYTNDHALGNEWVYNRADMDRARVVWARDLGPERNRELIAAFPNRAVLLALPDRLQPELRPYAEAAPAEAVGVAP